MSNLFNLTSYLPRGPRKLQYQYDMLRPIELQMEKSLINSKKFDLLAAHRLLDDPGNPLNEFLPVSSITQKDPNSKWNIGHGMISLYNQKQDEGLNILSPNRGVLKPKLAICITMYNESRKELESTLEGILKNMKHFKNELQINNEEIIVVVIYDGIDRINSSIDTDDNMIEYFNLWDRTDGRQFNRGIKKYTLQREYNEYKMNLEKANFKVEKLKEEEFKILKENPNLGKKFQNYVKSFKGKENDNRAPEQQKTDFLYMEQNEAMEYINTKQNNAVLYQMRVRLQKIIHTGDSETETPIQDNNPPSARNEDKKPKCSESDEDNYLHIFHCIKYKNGGKLSSHLWFFSGFCELFQPDHTILVDCGLIPGEKALLDLYVALETDKNIGGVCGFMGIKLQQEEEIHQGEVGFFSKLYHQLFSIQKAQMFEYNMGHFIDKPFESFFGFIHVLPGAFSGYRWEALKRDENGNSILDDYLSSVLDVEQELTLEQQNMNLAEDRILCLKIFSKKNRKYHLKYIRTATAKVDPVTDLQTLVAQRRRWINGSHFALDESIKKKNIVFESNHTPMELLCFKISMQFGKFSQFLGQMALSIYFTIIFIMILMNVKSATQGNTDSSLAISITLSSILIVAYLICVLSIIYYSISFNNRNPKSISLFYTASTFLGTITMISFLLMIFYVINVGIYLVQLYIFRSITQEEENSGLLKDWDNKFLRDCFAVIVLAGFGVNIIPALFYPSRMFEILKSFPHFLGYSAQYIHLLLIYAICRIDDLSWGTKSSSDNGGVQQEVSKMIKFGYVTRWLTLNVGVGLILSIIMTSPLIQDDPNSSQAKQYIIFCLSMFFAGYQIFRVSFSTLYEIGFVFFRIRMYFVKRRIVKSQLNQLSNKIEEFKHLFDQQLKMSAIPRSNLPKSKDEPLLASQQVAIQFYEDIQ